MAHTNTLAAALGAAALLTTISATPALALDGRDAVVHCMQQGANACTFAAQGDGSIRITTREGQTLRCASASAPCAMLYAPPRQTQIAQAPAARTGR